MVLSYNIYGARQYYLFTVCTEQMRSPYTEHAAGELPNPTPLEEEVRFVKDRDQQVLLHSHPEQKAAHMGIPVFIISS